MNKHSDIVAECGKVTLTMRQLLETLHKRSQLDDLIKTVLVDKLVLAEAGQAGLEVSDEELQLASDQFRRQNGLHNADSTQEWLSRQRLSVEDFEQALEQQLLMKKTRSHLIDGQIKDVFDSNRSLLGRLSLRQMVVSHKSLAEELILQLEEEGQEFQALAEKHSIDTAKSAIGEQFEIFRMQLPAEIRDACANVTVGQLIGPVTTSRGFYILKVEDVFPATLDKSTQAFLREVLVQQWVDNQLSKTKFLFP